MGALRRETARQQPQQSQPRRGASAPLALTPPGTRIQPYALPAAAGRHTASSVPATATQPGPAPAGGRAAAEAGQQLHVRQAASASSPQQIASAGVRSPAVPVYRSACNCTVIVGQKEGLQLQGHQGPPQLHCSCSSPLLLCRQEAGSTPLAAERAAHAAPSQEVALLHSLS